MCEFCGIGGAGCCVCGEPPTGVLGALLFTPPGGDPRPAFYGVRTVGQHPHDARDNRVERATCAECEQLVTGWERIGGAVVCWECEGRAAAACGEGA